MLDCIGLTYQPCECGHSYEQHMATATKGVRSFCLTGKCGCMDYTECDCW